MRGNGQIRKRFVEDALARRFAMDSARTLGEYHVQFVEPVAKMVEYLSLPWWKRLVTKKPALDFNLQPSDEINASIEELYGKPEIATER